jgi:hypothetical protein
LKTGDLAFVAGIGAACTARTLHMVRQSKNEEASCIITWTSRTVGFREKEGAVEPVDEEFENQRVRVGKSKEVEG